VFCLLAGGVPVALRLDSVDSAVEAMATGAAVVVVDDESQTSQGNIVFSAERATAELVRFAIRYGPGNLAVALTDEQGDRLALPPLYPSSVQRQSIAYTATVDAADCDGTGSSAAERARTIRVLAEPSSRPSDLDRPGHIAPLRILGGGVLRRSGHSEAAVDLSLLAGLQPVAVVSEVVSERQPGEIARAAELRHFADTHGLMMISIADLIAIRLRSERLVEGVTQARLPLPHGQFTAYGYRSPADGREHVALVCGELGDGENVLTRVHLECVVGDVFESQRCGCARRLQAALTQVADAGRGVVLYIRAHEGDTASVLQGFQEHDAGARRTTDTHDAMVADVREIGIGCQILVDIGVRSLHVLSNNAARYAAIEGFGLRVTGRTPLADNGAFE
jgi:3,4-dihydroxy 2-butanone 4-phosphate synthase/GTP cyclohydrolase II